jgi:hypothetical protein
LRACTRGFYAGFVRKRMTVLCGAVFVLSILNGWADMPTAQTNQELLKKEVKASLIFETSPKHPTCLRVYLHLVNLTDTTLDWSAYPSQGVMELIGPDGKPVATLPGTSGVSVLGRAVTFTLNGSSRMDLPISLDWQEDDPKGDYVLVTAGHIWSIPKDKVAQYSLRVRFPGVFPAPNDSPSERLRAQHPWNLFEIPPQKIVISPSTN